MPETKGRVDIDAVNLNGDITAGSRPCIGYRATMALNAGTSNSD
jgi:hypothetical protein